MILFTRLSPSSATDSTAAIALHTAIRAIANDKQNLEETYRSLILSFYPIYQSVTAAAATASPSSKVLRHSEAAAARRYQRLADLLYRLDQSEALVASCYSVSLALHVLALTEGIETEIVVAVRKADETLLGHAWLRFPQSGATVNPGNLPLENYKQIKVLGPWPAIEAWVKQQA